MPNVLTKFLSKKEYMEDFSKGKLYLSNLTEFTTIYSEKKLIEAANAGDIKAVELLQKMRNTSQQDCLEGTIATISPDQVWELEEDFRDVMCTDIMLKSSGYDFCNIMCFCKLFYDITFPYSKLGFIWSQPQMDDFGDYVVIIKDSKEFIRRVTSAMKRNGYKFICGDVNYHEVKYKDNSFGYKHTMTVETVNPIMIDDLLRRKHNTIIYDSFDKIDRYKNQNEWRITVNNGKKDKLPLIVNVGDLSDIIIKTTSDNITAEMQKLLFNFDIVPLSKEYIGNVSRDEMRKSFYDMGDKKGKLVSTIG